MILIARLDRCFCVHTYTYGLDNKILSICVDPSRAAKQQKTFIGACKDGMLDATTHYV